VVLSCAPAAWLWPLSRSLSVRFRPAPGWTRLPTTRPIASATVDITTKYSSARPPTLPTLAAWRTEPMPSTSVQKMIGLIIILIRFTNPVPSGFSSTAKSGNRKPTPIPSATATITAM
jgi:hypothetical protein